ncbi:MAG: hypothetical protein PVJ41_07670, partial [Desulfobacterales bacterium]
MRSPALFKSIPKCVTVEKIDKPNYRKIVLCHLGCGNSSNIFQKRLPGVVGAEVSPGSLTRLFPTP